MKKMSFMYSVLPLAALVSLSGCWSASTKDSPQGGIVPMDEGFSITVPKNQCIVNQGSSIEVDVKLNRGAYFKRDVQMVFQTEGIRVTPNDILIKASDKAELKLNVVATRDSAIGEYAVKVKGTPENGNATVTTFIVKVIAQ